MTLNRARAQTSESKGRSNKKCSGPRKAKWGCPIPPTAFLCFLKVLGLVCLGSFGALGAGRGAYGLSEVKSACGLPNGGQASCGEQPPPTPETASLCGLVQAPSMDESLKVLGAWRANEGAKSQRSQARRAAPESRSALETGRGHFFSSKTREGGHWLVSGS